MNALVTLPNSNAEVYRASTDAAGLCKDIVVASAMSIQGRKYVRVEGWQAIAIAHGCTGSAREVERVDGGVRAIGEVRRMSDGVVIAEAEGFVGEDEPTWFGGRMGSKTLPKRADYAIRAMAQTRAISRACRSAFAHVVVMMNAGLSTTPAEEVPLDGFDDHRDEPRNVTPPKKTEPPIPVVERGLYVACAAAIGLCTSAEDCDRWVDDNQASLAKIKADDAEVYTAVLALWKARRKEVAKPAPVTGEFVLDDEIPEFN